MFNYKKIFLFTLSIAIFIIIGVNVSASSIITEANGTLISGQRILISGNGFGIKNPAKPYLWAPFDDSLTPSSLGIVQSWDAIGGMEFVSNEGIKGGGGIRSVEPPDPVPYSHGAWAMGIDADGFAWNDWNQKMYIHRKLKRNFEITDSLNWKSLRCWGDPALGGHTYPNFYFQSGNGNIAVEGVAYTSNWMHNREAARGPVGQWRTDEIWIKSNSAADKDDGTLDYYADGQLVISSPYFDYSQKIWKMRDASESGSSDMIRLYPVHGVKANTEFPAEYQYWADNVYVDTTWARVMIGDDPDFENCTFREPQIPSAWSSTGIEVTVNTGEFPTGKNVFVFVVDADGNPSPGFGPVTIGQSVGEDYEPMSAPGGVHFTTPTQQ